MVCVMKIVVIGATGIVGAAVAKALAARKHDVIGASRGGEIKLNIEDPASIKVMFDGIRDVGAVVCCAGNAVFKLDLTDANYDLGLRSKLMGQVLLARIATDHLRDAGSITLTESLRCGRCRGAPRSP